MKVAILSHSNAHERQILFFQELAKHCEVLLIAPSNWGSLEPGNLIIFTNGKRFEMKSFPVVNPGNIYNYLWHARVFESISEFKPDLIYSVSEWQSLASRQVKEWSKQISCKFVLFTWDNLNFPDDKQRGLFSYPWNFSDRDEVRNYLRQADPGFWDEIYEVYEQVKKK